MNKKEIIKKGTYFILTTGDCIEDGIIELHQARKDIDIKKIRETFKKHIEETPFMFDDDFYEWFFDNG